jgi:DNA helicase-2/ATP-dependent DNA helicase PcrA
VLFRTGHDSDLLELELTRRGIPFVKYGGLRYLEAAHVKDFIALLRLADNPADELSWFRVLQLLDGVGPTRARRILDALRAPDGEGTPRLERWPQARARAPRTRGRAGERRDRRAPGRRRGRQRTAPAPRSSGCARRSHR